MGTLAQAPCSLVGELDLTLQSPSVLLPWQVVLAPKIAQITSRHYEPQILPL